MKLHRMTNVDCRMTNCGCRFRLRLRLRPDRSLSLLKIDRSTQKLTTGRIHYSMFDVGRSMFDVHQFFIWFDWTLAASGRVEPWTLNPEPLNPEPIIDTKPRNTKLSNCSSPSWHNTSHFLWCKEIIIKILISKKDGQIPWNLHL